MYVATKSKASINGFTLLSGKIYKIEIQVLEQSINNGEEYFFQKNLVSFLIDKEEELLDELENIIKEGKKHEEN